MSSCDSGWDVDLICKYFKESSAKVASAGSWFQYMDPKHKLDDRKNVWDLLTNQPSHTKPDDVGTSMIPWNQLNNGIVKSFHSNLACGSVVKLTFTKYMGWRSEPNSRSMSFPKWDGIAWLKKSLAAGHPVRAFLQTRHHYVGIVGYSERYVQIPPLRFLVMDPWPGGADTGENTLKYAGAETSFLGVATVEDGKILYDRNRHAVTALQGFYPFGA